MKESKPASCLYTSGKSKSTPASTKEVAITLHGNPRMSLSFISANFFFRCAGHKSVVRQKAPSFGSLAYNSCAVLRLFTIHNTCPAFSSRVCSPSNEISPILQIFARLNCLYKSDTLSHISRIRTPGKYSANIRSNTGCVAVHKTTDD